MIHVDGFHKVRRLLQHGSVQPVEAHLPRTGLQTSLLEDILETDTPPARIAQILQQTDLSRTAFRPVLNAFGLCCYLVSPQGAAKLAQRVLPLRLDGVPIPGLEGTIVRGTSIDRRMNALFPDLRAFVMRPFLAWTPNTDSSTR
jgi:hypothetical protein